jgi:hypothetical protein
MRSYYWRWLKTALTHSIGVFDLWTGLISAALGVLDHYWPQAQIMTTYAWQIPIFALAAVMFVRLLLAPYWMWKTDNETTIAIADELEKSRDLLNERDRKRDASEKLADLLRRSDALCTKRITSDDECSKFHQELISFLNSIPQSVSGIISEAEAAVLISRVPTDVIDGTMDSTKNITTAYMF